MCDFLSAIVLRNGDILHNLRTDSHEDLIQENNLRDNKIGNFARVEFRPKEINDLDKPGKYLLTIDEKITPDWFDDSMKEKIISKLSSIIKRIIITEDRNILLGGVYILSGKANIKEAKNVLIKYMSGSSSIGSMYDSSRIGAMYDSSSIESMYDSSRIGSMSNSSRIDSMFGSSGIGTMYDSSRIESMSGSSRIESMSGSSSLPKGKKPKNDYRG